MKGENGRVKKKREVWFCDYFICEKWWYLRPSNMAGPYGATERYAVGTEGLGQEQEEGKSLYSLIKASVAFWSKAMWKKMSDSANEDRCSWKADKHYNGKKWHDTIRIGVALCTSLIGTGLCVVAIGKGYQFCSKMCCVKIKYLQLTDESVCL